MIDNSTDHMTNKYKVAITAGVVQLSQAWNHNLHEKQNFILYACISKKHVFMVFPAIQ